MINRVALINGKGGCGKTTSIVHIAGVLAKAGEKVLVIDLDKQRNAGNTLLMNAQMPTKTVFEFMQGKATAEEATGQALFQSRGNAKPKYCGVDCMVASKKLEKERELRKIDAERFHAELNQFIEDKGYTWVLVDMPPSNDALNEICFNGIVDFVIVPFSSDTYSVDGYGDIIETIDEAREVNPSLNVLGVYLSRYMRSSGVDCYIKQQLEENFDTFIPVQIPQATDVREGIIFGRPISYYKERSASRTAYEELVAEMQKRINANR